MDENLPRSARRVQDALAAAGLEARVVELPASAHTAQQAAEAIGCGVEQIAKSVIFRRGDTGLPVLVLLRGVDRVDTRALARHLGAEVKRADPDFVRASTGFAIGGVPPIGHPEPVQTILDTGLLAYDNVWAAAGTPQAVFQAQPRRLADAYRMEVAAVAESSSEG